MLVVNYAAEVEVKTDNMSICVSKAEYEKFLAYQAELYMSSSTPIASTAPTLVVWQLKYVSIGGLYIRGASTHFCGNQCMFSNFYTYGYIRLTNGSLSPIKGK